jgi:tryptophanyl-tRNA synthetase
MIAPRSRPPGAIGQLWDGLPAQEWTCGNLYDRRPQLPAGRMSGGEGGNSKVTPWEVRGVIDYDELVVRFGTSRLEGPAKARLIQLAGEDHWMLRRDIFYSHRDLEVILDRQAKGRPWALYTGRGPSGHTHLGHTLPWVFNKWLQDRFKVPMYFQLTDDEKFVFSPELSLGDTHSFAVENALDFLALGFDPKLTKVIIDTDLVRSMYPIALRAAKRITFSTARAVFGFTNENNIGQIFYTSMQSVPAFLPSELAGEEVPTLIPAAIDQDAHFRITRDVAPHLGYPKPCLLHCKLLPSLLGGDKMSASDPASSIYTTDKPKAVRKKLMNAFTGGQVSVEEQRRLGANPDVCPVWWYESYLFEPDDAKLADIERRCRSGEMLCGEHKQALYEKVERWLERHQAERERLRERLDEFIMRD